MALHLDLKRLSDKAMDEWQAVERVLICADMLRRYAMEDIALRSEERKRLVEHYDRSVADLRKVRG